MAKKQKSNNLDFIISKLTKCVGDIKVIEHSKGISFGGIHEVNQKQNTLRLINEAGLEKIKASEKDSLSTDEVYSNPIYMEIISLDEMKSVK